MYKQEIFDKVAKHLLTQNCRSQDIIKKKCMYRDNEGRKCAVGCLIPDDKYYPLMDFMFQPLLMNATVRTALEDVGIDLTKPGVQDLLVALQNAHDGFEPGEWVEQLRGLTKTHKLNVPDFLQ